MSTPLAALINGGSGHLVPAADPANQHGVAGEDLADGAAAAGTADDTAAEKLPRHDAARCCLKSHRRRRRRRRSVTLRVWPIDPPSSLVPWLSKLTVDKPKPTKAVQELPSMVMRRPGELDR